MEESEIERRRIYLYKLNIMYIKLAEFCELVNYDIYVRDLAIMITNKVYKHPNCKKCFTNWYYVLISAFFISVKFFDDQPITITDLLHINVYSSREFLNSNKTYILKCIKKLEIDILKILNYQIPRIYNDKKKYTMDITS